MKKNLMSVLIMALVFVNVVLTAIVMITLVPTAKRSNELITEVCNAIDLELESGKDGTGKTIPIEQLDVISLTPESATYSLKDNGDGEMHVVVLDVSMSLDKEHEDYESKKEQITGKEALLLEIVSDTFRRYTIDMVKTTEGLEEVRQDMLEQMRDLFDSNCVAAVNFSNVNCQ